MSTKSVILLLIVILNSAYSKKVEIPDLGAVLGTTIQSAWTNRTIYSFYSVKYGKSPSGERRFAPPEPIDPWKEVYDATKPGIRCPQVTHIEDFDVNSSEDIVDCLTMDIFTPMLPDKSDRSELLPVMVFYHGGGFFDGESKVYPPNYILEKDVLLIMPQYRLGPLGFLSLHTDNIPGNAGLMDQLLALKWVNKHIEHFGGDNKRVTIFGESAGAASVSLMLLSPAVEPHLFQQIIVQSGSAFAFWAVLNDPVKNARELYKRLTNSNEEPSIQQMEDKFLQTPLNELLRFAHDMEGIHPVLKLQFRPTVQKAGSIRFLTETPEEIIKSGKYRTVPMMAGVTKDEGSFFLPALYDKLKKLRLLDDNEYLRNDVTEFMLNMNGINDISGTLMDTLNDRLFQHVFEKKTNVTFSDLVPGLMDLLGMIYIKAPTLRQAKINVKREIDTYLYTFNYNGEHTLTDVEDLLEDYPYDLGVFHGDDLLYLFPYDYMYPLNEKCTKVAHLMTDLWTSFAIDGKPTSSRLTVQWPSMKKNMNGPYMLLNEVCRLDTNFVDSEYFSSTNEAYSEFNSCQRRRDESALYNEGI